MGYGLANIYEVTGLNSEPTRYPLARVGSVSLGQLEIVGSGRKLIMLTNWSQSI